MCTASPAKSTDPRRYTLVERRWHRNVASQVGSDRLTRCGARWSTRRWISSKVGASWSALAGVGEDQSPDVVAEGKANHRRTVGAEEGVELVLSAGPVHTHVSQQPVLGVGVAVEAERQLVAHPAVGAVAADQVSADDCVPLTTGVFDCRGHPFSVLVHGEQLDSSARPSRRARATGCGAGLRSRFGG